MESSRPDHSLPISTENGVYLIKNAKNGKVYVGSTSQGFRTRFSEHQRRLRAGTHKNKHLQAAWAIDGEDAFEFTVLETVSDLDILLEAEAKWMALFHLPDPDLGYNTRKDPASNRGAKLGPMSPERKRQLSEAHKGYNPSAETREKLRLLKLGTKGPPLSEEHKRKLSLALKGKRPHAYSDEWRAKMAAHNAAQKGKKMPPRTPEHSAKISESLRKLWAMKKRERRSGDQQNLRFDFDFD